jgi:hypothetical protein
MNIADRLNNFFYFICATFEVLIAVSRGVISHCPSVVFWGFTATVFSSGAAEMQAEILAALANWGAVVKLILIIAVFIEALFILVRGSNALDVWVESLISLFKTQTSKISVDDSKTVVKQTM